MTPAQDSAVLDKTDVDAPTTHDTVVEKSMVAEESTVVEKNMVVEELLVEEISIDGMCGVY